MRLVSFAAVSGLLATCLAAHANTVTFSGTTVGGPMFNDPFTFLNIYDVGGGQTYSVEEFNVSLETSVYISTVAGAGSHDWANRITTILYQSSFDPTQPLTNELEVRTGAQGAFPIELSAGTNYFLVTTGPCGTGVGSGPYVQENYADFCTFQTRYSQLYPGPDTGAFQHTIIINPRITDAGANAIITDLGNVTTPEPSSFVLLGTGLLGMAGVIRRRLS